MPYREDIPGSMGLHDFMALEALAACVPDRGIVVEVGSYYGRSAWAWAHSVLPSVTVYCIDPWPGALKKGEDAVPGLMRGPSLNDFKENMKDCPNVVAIQGYSPTMAWNPELKPDLVFIDGNHLSPHVDQDILFWTRQLKPNGILCGHDFRPFDWPDVCEAVIRQAGALKKPFRIFEKSSIWYIELEKKMLNRDSLANRLFLETMSWQPSPDEVQQIKSMYNQDIFDCVLNKFKAD